MPGSGTRTFLEPDYFEANLHQAQIEILVALSSQFKARLTWAELHDLEVLQCEEDFPRVAYVCLGPQLSFVTFPAHSGPVPVWGGTELRPGEIVFHGNPLQFSDAVPRARRLAPALAEHNAEVYAEIGVEAAELERLRAAGIV